jgi:hypothetical protein
LPDFKIFDTFRDFQLYWDNCNNKTTKEQIENWFLDYMNKWPDLRDKQIEDYEKSGYNWREIAQKYVFQNLSDRMDSIRLAHSNLIEILPSIFKKAQGTLDINFKILFVIYVGIGLGAGWATRFREESSILFGLENIAEERWEKKETLKGLTAHEIGHLFHFNLREKMSLEIGYPSPLWQLYEEGFAMRCEHVIMDNNSWHQRGESNNWLKWCIENKNKLASKFLYYLDNNIDIKDFFGSWFNVDEYKQTGYFLGHEIIKKWERTLKLNEIAIMDIGHIQEQVINTLKIWSSEDS